MLANDYEWFTYGGVLDLTDAYKPPAGDAVAAYEVYASGPPKTFEAGYILDQLPDGVNRYVTDGGGVSIPSENLGYYFGGLRSASWGPIYYLPGAANESLNADQLSLTLIELDMTIQQQETWDNYTLPTEAPGRASAEIVWIPVSKQGILVALGGVIFPAYDNVNQTNNASANAASVSFTPRLGFFVDNAAGTTKSTVHVDCVCVRYRQQSLVRAAHHGCSGNSGCFSTRLYRSSISSRWVEPQHLLVWRL